MKRIWEIITLVIVWLAISLPVSYWTWQLEQDYPVLFMLIFYPLMILAAIVLKLGVHKLFNWTKPETKPIELRDATECVFFECSACRKEVKKYLLTDMEEIAEQFKVVIDPVYGCRIPYCIECIESGKANKTCCH